MTSTTMTTQRTLSGIQPTGNLHLGNYIGAIQQWVNLQNNTTEAFYAIVNLHAITVDQDPKTLKEQTLNTAAMYLACGLDPEKSTIFVQSEISAHAELAWILTTQTPMGELERMTQYKDKVAKGKSANVGLFTYPILQAADILLYQPTIVPIGEDQQQHVEFARMLAKRFNNKFGEVFTVPRHVQQTEGARIMGLDDPSQKMSKSAESEYNYINLNDTPDIITKKIKRATTDSLSTIRFNKEEQPAITNLLTIYKACTQQNNEEIEKHFEGKQYGDLKTELANAVIDHLAPIQKRYNKLKENKQHLEEILSSGKEKAEAIANKTLKDTKAAVGL